MLRPAFRSLEETLRLRRRSRYLHGKDIVSLCKRYPKAFDDCPEGNADRIQASSNQIDVAGFVLDESGQSSRFDLVGFCSQTEQTSKSDDLMDIRNLGRKPQSFQQCHRESQPGSVHIDSDDSDHNAPESALLWSNR